MGRKGNFKTDLIDNVSYKKTTFLRTNKAHDYCWLLRVKSKICGRCNVFMKQPSLMFVSPSTSLSRFYLLVSLILSTQLLSGCGGGEAGADGGSGTPPNTDVTQSKSTDTQASETDTQADGSGSGSGGNIPAPSVPNDPPVGNVAPVANSGAFQVVAPYNNVTLDGTGSSDANGDRLTYSWKISSKPAGSQASLANKSTSRPFFTADLEGKYILELVVNDGQVNSAASMVTVTAAAFSVTVSWAANKDNPTGYAVYAGATSNNTNQLVQTLVRNSGGWDQNAPSTDIDSATILDAVGAAKQACFVIKAFNGLTTSAASNSTCANLPY